MAFHTKTHVQCLILRNTILLGDIAMAGGAINAFRDMSLVIEINMIRHVMHLNPVEWFIFLVSLS